MLNVCVPKKQLYFCSNKTSVTSLNCFVNMFYSVSSNSKLNKFYSFYHFHENGAYYDVIDTSWHPKLFLDFKHF